MPAGQAAKKNRVVAGRDVERRMGGVKDPVVDAICNNVTRHRRRLMPYPIRQAGRNRDQRARPAELSSIQWPDKPDQRRELGVRDRNVAICAVDLLNNRDTP